MCGSTIWHALTRKSEATRAAFAGLDRRPRAAERCQPVRGPATRASKGGAFDRMIADLNREPARAASGSRTAGPEPDPSELLLMFEEDEHRRLRAVRHHVPPTRLERLTAELIEASKPAPPTAEEMRAERRRLDQERELRKYRRVCAEYRAWRRAFAEEAS